MTNVPTCVKIAQIVKGALNVLTDFTLTHLPRCVKLVPQTASPAVPRTIVFFAILIITKIPWEVVQCAIPHARPVPQLENAELASTIIILPRTELVYNVKTDAWDARAQQIAIKVGRLIIWILKILRLFVHWVVI